MVMPETFQEKLEMYLNPLTVDLSAIPIASVFDDYDTVRTIRDKLVLHIGRHNIQRQCDRLGISLTRQPEYVYAGLDIMFARVNFGLYPRWTRVF